MIKNRKLSHCALPNCKPLKIFLSCIADIAVQSLKLNFGFLVLKS